MVKVASFLNSVPLMLSNDFSSGLDLHPLKPKNQTEDHDKKNTLSH
jgi:hypothetical protein